LWTNKLRSYGRALEAAPVIVWRRA